jgi:hypothetical protein
MANLQSMAGFDLICMVTMNLNVFRGFSQWEFLFLFSQCLYFKVSVAEMVTKLNEAPCVPTGLDDHDHFGVSGPASPHDKHWHPFSVGPPPRDFYILRFYNSKCNGGETPCLSKSR